MNFHRNDDAGSIRLLLRSATAGQHAQVDAHFAPLVASGEPAYADFLRASARAIYPLERALDAANVDEDPAGLESSVRDPRRFVQTWRRSI